MTGRIGSTPNTNTIRPGGGNVIRPMYGIFIRDNVARFRNEIGSTLNDTKQAIAHGDPTGKAIPGDGILQGAELKKAKLAVKELEKAIKALKPVFPNLPGGRGPILNPVRPGGGGIGVGGGGGIHPMYGVVFRDDLSKFRTEIQTNIRDIRAGINSGELKGTAKTEAQKAIKYLEAAAKDLGTAANTWG